MDCPSRADVSKFHNMLTSSGLSQLVKTPTQRSGHTLDLVITRESEDLLSSVHVNNITMSDHAIVTMLVHQKRPPKNLTRSLSRRYRAIDQDQFDKDLSDQLNNLPKADDVNDTLKSFDDAVLTILDKHAPHVDRVSTTRHRPEWYNSEIDKARRDRRCHERRWRKL